MSLLLLLLASSLLDHGGCYAFQQLLPIPLPDSAFAGRGHKLMALPGIPETFEQLGQQLADTLDVGSALRDDVGSGVLEAATTSLVLESIGRDLLVFLSASVAVTTVATALGITPILGYLIAGAFLGPHGLDLFANSRADVELGDFGILFLLFSEGLEVSTTRLQQLTNYLPLGLAQISLTTAALTAALVVVAPQLAERLPLPLDTDLIDLTSPAEVFVLAVAGALSTSAFVFPVLKEREWEEEDAGKAATSILLLQDLAVAPLLVILPYVVGQGPVDYAAIGFLTAKAIIGFGSVAVAGSFFLRRLFRLVAQTRSTETFVALGLLVSVGMGVIAKSLGLTDTAGAFAAGVLLANTNYRAQIQADILPFKGILLGIFFMDAGSNFDSELLLTEWPTIVAGVISLVTIKALTLFSATRVPRWLEPNRLPLADGIRLSLLLAGGGEFAFVVLALAEKLDVLPKDLGGILTANVLITMGVTPLLGNLAADASEPFIVRPDSDSDMVSQDVRTEEVASDAFVVCGCGEVGQSLLQVLGDEFRPSEEERSPSHNIVAFDTNPSLAEDSKPTYAENIIVLFGDGSNPEVLRSSGVTDPAAIFISYDEHSTAMSATFRLRASFEQAPIYSRAQTRSEALALKTAGATEVVVESDELSRSAAALVRGKGSVLSPELRLAAAEAAGISLKAIDDMLELFDCMDRDGSGLLDASELAAVFRNSNKGIASDDEIERMEGWIRTFVPAPIDAIEFCRLYMRAPAFIQEFFSDACECI